MNFNLISPTGNGNDFKIDFRDPITIKQDSSMALNFCELTRAEEIELTADSTITATSLTAGFKDQNGQDPTTSVSASLPNRLPSAPVTTETFFGTGTIPKGSYTFGSLQNKITEVLQGFLSGVTNDYSSDYVALSTVNDDNKNNLPDQESIVVSNDIVMGYARKANQIEAFEHSTTHAHDAGTTDSSGLFCAYVNTSNTNTFDNYALANTHVDFYRSDVTNSLPNDPTTISGGGYSPYRNNGFGYFQSIHKVNDMADTDSLFIGLYSPEYANGLDPAPATRTTGNNPPDLDANGIPRCFCGVELQGQGGEIKIYRAKDNAGTTLTGWKSINQQFGDMELLERMPVSTSTDGTSTYQVEFAFEIENQVDTDEQPEIIWKIGLIQGETANIIFSSDAHRANLPNSLLVRDPTSTFRYTTAENVNSQIPFAFMLSATKNDDGFVHAEYTNFDKTANGAGAAKPRSLMRTYGLTLTNPLANALGLEENTSYTGLLPNDVNERAVALHSTLETTHKDKNYSIFINLPASNYKNIKDVRNGGFKKSILANIPAPFATGTIINNSGTDVGKITSVYQPYTPITSDLNNNDIQTNFLECKIVDMKTEAPATEITNSVINFTIHNKN